jgi:hypothetical protein
MNNELMMKYGLRNITRMTVPSFDVASRYAERRNTVWKSTSNRLFQGFQPLTGVKTLLGGAKRSGDAVGALRTTPLQCRPRTSAGTQHFFTGLTGFAGLTGFTRFAGFTGLSIMRRLVETGRAPSPQCSLQRYKRLAISPPLGNEGERKSTSNRLFQGFQPLTGVKTLLGGAKRSSDAAGALRATPLQCRPRTSAGTQHFFTGFTGFTRFTGLSIMRRLEKNPKDFLIRENSIKIKKKFV